MSGTLWTWYPAGSACTGPAADHSFMHVCVFNMTTYVLTVFPLRLITAALAQRARKLDLAGLSCAAAALTDNDAPKD